MPQAGLGYHFLRMPVRDPRILGGLQEEVRPKSARSRTERRDDGGSCVSHVSEVLGLASCHSEESENRRYVRMISPNIPLCDLASLNWVSHRVPSSFQEHNFTAVGRKVYQIHESISSSVLSLSLSLGHYLQSLLQLGHSYNL